MALDKLAFRDDNGVMKLAPWLLLVLLSLTNCTLAQVDPTEPPDGWCAEHRCDRHPTTFAPAPGLEAFTEAALLRIRVATGRDDLEIDPAGVPIGFSDGVLIDPNNSFRSCAQTMVQGWVTGGPPDRTQGILLDPSNDNCPGWTAQLVHEITHALNPTADHAGSGVFQSHIEQDVINEDSLLKLCSDFQCTAMQTED